MIVFKRLRRATVSAICLTTALLAASAAEATDFPTYNFSGNFSGTTLSGSFSVDYSHGGYTLEGLTFALNGTNFTTTNSSLRVVNGEVYVGGNNLQADGLGGLFANNDFSIGFGFNSQTGVLTSFDSFRIVTTTNRVVVRGNDLSFAGPPPAAVPEPASWALMLGGFGLIGAAMRSRRTTAVRFG